MLFMPLTAGSVHVRSFDLDREEPHSACLTADEQARAARFHFERDARHWAVGRSLLRRTLGAYLGADPSGLHFETGPFGKLSLPSSPLRFNLSHSGSVLLIALAWDKDVGIDVEHLRSDFAAEELSALVFSPKEQAALCRVLPAERHPAFLRLWTAKEAYVKALGTGLSFPLPQLTLMEDAGRYRVEDLTAGSTHPALSVRCLDTVPGYAASLAAAGTLTDVQQFGSYVP